jgi:hypothetical protein
VTAFCYATQAEGQWYAHPCDWYRSNAQDLICYQLDNFPKFSIDPCSTPTGGFCGAMYLDIGFQKFVRNKLGSSYANILTPDQLIKVNKYFEDAIKVEFDPTKPTYPEGQFDFQIPFPGVPDVPGIGLRSGYLEVKKYRLDEK